MSRPVALTRVRTKTQVAKLIEAIPDAEELNDAQNVFCKEYCWDFNATRAYKIAYPAIKKDSVIRAGASRLLTYANIKVRIAFLKENAAESLGISKQKIMAEHYKLAFSSIAHLHDTWITRKEFEDLTTEQKDAIQEITTQTRIEVGEDEITREVDYVKIKLYDKQRSLDSLSKMGGFDAPTKIETKNFNINVEVTADEARKILQAIEKNI